MSQRPGFIELGLGHPDPELAPVDLLADAAQDALRLYGRNTFNYGHNSGPGPLADFLAERIAQTEGMRPRADSLFITGGTSQALDHLLTLIAQPGDAILVESPVYHLALHIFHDHHLRVFAVPSDAEGPTPDGLRDTLLRAQAAGVQPRALYGVPTYNNPSGASWSVQRRIALLEIAQTHALLILEDDVYRELSYDAEAAPSLWALQQQSGSASSVVRFGSFSKSLAAGLRVGWLTGPPAVIARLSGSGLIDSGGGINQFAAMTAAAFCESGAYDAQVAQYRAAYRARRDALLDEVRARLPEASFHVPGGGFFAWIELPPSVSTLTLLAQAQSEAVGFVPGVRFFAENDAGLRGAHAMRVCFALYAPDNLREGVRRLARALRA